MKIKILVILCIFAYSVKAENIHGRIFSNKGVAIEYANVVVLDSNDSTYINGTVSDKDGAFSINVIKEGKRVLRVSSLGHMTKYLPITQEDLGNITLTENDMVLGEVLIKGSMSKYKLNGEGITTSVVGTSLEKVGSIEQLLTMIPYVTAKNGNVEVFGRGTPEIYINGRKVTDFIELERYQSDDIKSVEVINNPGAQYKTNVKSVIRILTKRPKGEGISFDSKTLGRINEEKRWSSFETFRINYRKRKLDINGFLFGEYSHSEDDKIIQQYTYLHDKWKQNTEICQEYTNVRPYARLENSYVLNDSNFIGLSISYNRFAKNYGEGSQHFDTECNSKLTESSESRLQSPARSTTYLTNIYYNGKIGNLKIDFNTDYMKYSKKEWMSVQEIWEEANHNNSQQVNTYRRNRNLLFASKLILSHPFLGGIFSTGNEISSLRRNMDYYVIPNVTDEENDQVQESMYSAYINYCRNVGSVYIQAGIRYEYIDFNYYDKGVRILEQSKKYRNVFPSLALSFPVGKVQMQVTYATDIRRPSYNELRNGVQYDNRYTYETGNPFLVSSISNNIGYALSWKWLNIQLSYSHNANGICTVVKTYKNDPMKSLAIPENIKSYDKFTLSSSVSHTFGFWSPSVDMFLSKQWFKMNTSDGDKLNAPVFVVEANNIFNLKWMIATFSITGQTEGHIANQFVRKGFLGCDLTLTKSLFNEKLKIQFEATDLFHTANTHVKIYSGANRTTWIDSLSSSTFSLSLRYTFNSYSNKYKGSSAGESQRNRIN